MDHPPCPRYIDDGSFSINEGPPGVDGAGDACDACPATASLEQGDQDEDADGAADVSDNCPNTPNDDQLDGDRGLHLDFRDGPGSVTLHYEASGELAAGGAADGEVVVDGWEHGVPSSGPGAEGGAAWATSLLRQANPDAGIQLHLPPVTVPAGARATLTLRDWFNWNNYCDTDPTMPPILRPLLVLLILGGGLQFDPG